MFEFLLEELTIEILLKLSKKDLARFKSVCKKWRDLINHRGFTERYLEIAPATFVTFHDNDLYLLDVECKNPIKKLDFPIDQSMIDESICVLHCNGTLCITLKNHSLLIWNPSSEQFKIVPNPDLNRDLTILGFGYDPVLNDYKIVTFIDRLESSTVLVFDFKTGSWRETVQIPYPDWYYRDRKGIFLNRNLYWIAYRSNINRFILCFNLTTNQYRKLPLPVNNEDTICYWLSVINQKLCVIEYEPVKKEIQISVMEKTGLWNKIITFSMLNWISVQDRSYDYEIDFVSFTKTNDLVVTSIGYYYDDLKMKFVDRTMKKVFLYKIGDRTVKEFQLCKDFDGIRFLDEYVESPKILNRIFMD